MPIFTFSTKTTRPADTDSIKKAKELCAKKGLNFSALVVRLIGEWLVEQESDDGKAKQ